MFVFGNVKFESHGARGEADNFRDSFGEALG